MKLFKRMPLWAFALIVLLLANLSLISLYLYQRSAFYSSGKQFKIEVLHTNDVSPWPYLSGNASAIGIVDAKSGQPVLAKWNLDQAKEVEIESYYFHGKRVFDVYWTNKRPVVYNVYFQGPGKSITWWRNRAGADTFTERTFYDTNGVLSKDEVWYKDAWQSIVKQAGNNGIGISVDGQWRSLGFDTNGMWTIEAP